MKRIIIWILSLCLLMGVCAAAESAEPSSTGNGLMPYDQVLKLIKWIDEGYYQNKTYEEVIAFTGVEGLDQGHRDTSITSLGDHYFDWIADSDPTHFIHVCFRGRDASDRFEACQWNTSGFSSEEWKNVDLTDWLTQTACHDTVETSLEIQRFSNPLVTVTADVPVSGWRTNAGGNTAYFYNDRGEYNNDPRIEVLTYDDPAMFDFYLDQWENVQPAGSRIIAGTEMQGRTYHAIGWDWTEYSAQLSAKVSICVRISRIDCGAGTEGGALLDSLRWSWTEENEPVQEQTVETPQVTAEPTPVITEAPTPEPTEQPMEKDPFAPDDPVEFIALVNDRPDSWQTYSFTNELNGVTLSFCLPMDAENGISDFYTTKDPTFNADTGKAYFYWRYDAAGSSKMRISITEFALSAKEYDAKSMVAHSTSSGYTFTTLKTDRGFTLYRRINDRGEARYAIVGDLLSDGNRALVLVDIENNGHPGTSWFDAIMTAFEGSVQLTIPGEEIAGNAVQPTAAPVPTAEVQPTAEPTAEPVIQAAAPAADLADYVGTWYSTWLHTAAMEGDPRSMFGFTMVLTLNADGTGDYDYLGSDGGGTWSADEEGIVRYWGEGTALSFLEDGTLCWGSYLSGYTLFSRDPNGTATVFPADPMAQETEAPVQAAPIPSTDNGGSTTGDYVGVKYIGKTYIAGGVSMDASMLGGEYAIVLNTDGTATFTMVGMEVPGYTWKQVDDHIDVDAYGTVMMNLSFDADGTMTMDYSGAFTLLLAPQ